MPRALDSALDETRLAQHRVMSFDFVPRYEGCFDSSSLLRRDSRLSSIFIAVVVNPVKWHSPQARLPQDLHLVLGARKIRRYVMLKHDTWFVPSLSLLCDYSIFRAAPNEGTRVRIKAIQAKCPRVTNYRETPCSR